MFTGIVETVGTITAIEQLGEDGRLLIEAPAVLDGIRAGASIAIDGVCLTVADIVGSTAFWADVMPETMRRSTLGALGVGSTVNVERAARVDSRLDGHIVQGHVDGVGMVLSRNPGPRWDEVTIGLPRELARYVAEKGSITVSGISLTVTAVTAESFSIALIPTTLAGTTLGTLGVGGLVNLEVDVIAKYVERLLTTRTEQNR